MRSRIAHSPDSSRARWAGALFAIAGLAASVLGQGREVMPNKMVNPAIKNVGAVNPSPEPAAAPAPAPSGEVSAGQAILQEAAAAIQRARALSYGVKFESTGQLAGMIPPTTATVRLVRTPDPILGNGGGTIAAPGRWVMHAVGKGSSVQSKKEVEFDVAWVGDHVEWVDHEKKQLIEKREVGAQSPILQIAKNARVEDLFSQSPLTKEIAPGASFEVLERVEVSGVLCDVVEVIRGNLKKHWAVGVDDRIPRQLKRITSGTYGGEISTTFTDLKVDFSDAAAPTLAFTPSDLRVRLPDGYAEDRVTTAPAPPPPPPPAPTAQPSNVAATPEASSPAPVAVTPPEPPKPAVVRAPDVTLKTPTGEEVSTASLRGKVVVLDFFGTWAVGIKDWHPRLSTLTREFAGVSFYAASLREKDPQAPVEHVRAGGFGFGLLLNAEAAARSFGAKVFPATIVVDAEGNIALTLQGARGEESERTLRETLARLTGASTPATPEAKPVENAPSGPEKDAAKES